MRQALQDPDYWDLERLQKRMMKEPWKAMKEALAQEHLTEEYNDELFLLLRECFRHNLLPDDLLEGSFWMNCI
jgi:hypothetical protein